MRYLYSIILYWISFTLFAQNPLPEMVSILDKAKQSTVFILVLQARGDQGFLPSQLREEILSNPDIMSYFQDRLGNEFNDLLNPLGLSAGSGAIVSKDGYILTNHHVVEKGKQFFVQLNDKSLRYASLIGKDKDTDLALLKIEGDNFPYFSMDKKNVQVGEWVFAIGAPYSYEQSVSFGIISALKRSGKQAHTNFIQHDAACNPGNSGGPLVNDRGELIGINSWGIATAIKKNVIPTPGLCFAIPMKVAHYVMKQLIDYHYVQRAWVGMKYQTLDPLLAHALKLQNIKGVIVTEVILEGPAHQAGIQTGDIITYFNEEEVDSVQDLSTEIAISTLQEPIPVIVYRDGEKSTLHIKAERLPSNEDDQPISMQKMANIHDQIHVRDLEPEERAPGIFGVAIVRIEGRFWAGSDLRRGDIILTFDGTPIQNEKQFNQLWEKKKKNQPIVFLIHRHAVGNFYETAGFTEILKMNH